MYHDIFQFKFIENKIAVTKQKSNETLLNKLKDYYFYRADNEKWLYFILKTIFLS